MKMSNLSCTVAVPRECNYATDSNDATNDTTSAEQNGRKPSSLLELRMQLRTQLTRNHSSNRDAKIVVELHTSAEPFDREAFEERAAICEFDGGLSRDRAEAIAWQEDDRRRCNQCLNLRNLVCSISKPAHDALVVANRGYRPANLPLRCSGYTPRPSDPDQRTGIERWSGL